MCIIQIFQLGISLFLMFTKTKAMQMKDGLQKMYQVQMAWYLLEFNHSSIILERERERERERETALNKPTNLADFLTMNDKLRELTNSVHHKDLESVSLSTDLI